MKDPFSHHNFKAFQKGKQVYRWAEVYDWSISKTKKERQKGEIIKKRGNSVTIKWIMNNRLEKYSIDEVLEKVALQYEPIDILKDIL